MLNVTIPHYVFVNWLWFILALSDCQAPQWNGPLKILRCLTHVALIVTQQQFPPNNLAHTSHSAPCFNCPFFLGGIEVTSLRVLVWCVEGYWLTKNRGPRFEARDVDNGLTTRNRCRLTSAGTAAGALRRRGFDGVPGNTAQMFAYYVAEYVSYEGLNIPTYAPVRRPGCAELQVEAWLPRRARLVDYITIRGSPLPPIPPWPFLRTWACTEKEAFVTVARWMGFPRVLPPRDTGNTILNMCDYTANRLYERQICENVLRSRLIRTYTKLIVERAQLEPSKCWRDLAQATAARVVPSTPITRARQHDPNCPPSTGSLPLFITVAARSVVAPASRARPPCAPAVRDRKSCDCPSRASDSRRRGAAITPLPPANQAVACGEVLRGKVTRVKSRETECTAATHERAPRHPLHTCCDVDCTTTFKWTMTTRAASTLPAHQAIRQRALQAWGKLTTGRRARVVINDSFLSLHFLLIFPRTALSKEEKWETGADGPRLHPVTKTSVSPPGRPLHAIRS
ncbi:hypothetical protein PR048_017937 [Dryococelus australis]|uniref:Uncharacterized protein n=1 Tax=Dryococelus australis TaxID=614101 RepID=A0ABQ9HB15_9NEOP|nr:hypothetical protein PR048_017937 [Dryococelus australis]